MDDEESEEERIEKLFSLPFLNYQSLILSKTIVVWSNRISQK